MKPLYKCLQFLTLTFITSICLAQQQSPGGALQEYIAHVDSAFQGMDTTAFNRLVGQGELRDFYTSVAKPAYNRSAGNSRIITITNDSAYVLLTGLVKYGNSGDETNLSTKYSGIYRLERTNGRWQIRGKVALDRANRIRKQQLGMSLIPAKGMNITDTLTIDVSDPLGFWVKLNHRARMELVLLNGRSVENTFNGGLLWVSAKLKKSQQLIITYQLQIESDEGNRNSGYFSAEYGHVRNQYYWHPFFGFSSPRDRADFSIYCTLPASHRIATSLPQRESITNNLRTVEAHSEVPTFGLSIYYDQKWEVIHYKKEQMELVTYTTADFQPSGNALYEEFSRDYDILRLHFGKPTGTYIGIVQDRSAADGWKNRSNSIVVAGAKGGRLITDLPSPRATFGHEIAHGWTSPSGPGTNFLMEGWATYAESLLLFEAYGEAVTDKFFQSQRQNYLDGGYEGKGSLWEDYNNGGISYGKGAWIFHMLEEALGREKFYAAMRKFIGSGDHSIGSFIRQFSRASGKDLEPALFYWLKGRTVPAVVVIKSPQALTITQQPETFFFPLEVAIQLKSGQKLLKKIDMTGNVQVIRIAEGEIESYVLDPSNKLLFTSAKREMPDK